jgi:hypothetical protein
MMRLPPRSLVKRGYEYRWYYQPGKEYKTWVRCKLDSAGDELIGAVVS